MKTSTLILLVAASVAILAMMGYNLWKQKKDADVRESLKSRYGLVTGIMYDEESPSAVIDLEIVREGETVQGVKVVKIYQDKVEFEKNGKR